MSDTVIIRPAARADLTDVLRLYAQPALDDGEVLSASAAEAVFERMMRYPEYRVYVALAGGAVVGTFALLIMDKLGHLGAPCGVIEDVAVDPALQGTGIGRTMVAHAIDLCNARGCYKVTLSSDLKREDAHAFYEAIGFERHGYSFRVQRPPQSRARQAARRSTAG